MSSADARWNVVWFKRDLRSQDHVPLYESVAEGRPNLGIWMLEPRLLQHPDWDLRHSLFQYHSATELQKKLARRGIPLVLLSGEAPEIIKDLLEVISICHIHSYQETGVKASYDRDLAVASVLKSSGIIWKEYDRNGVQRGRRDRQEWDQNWRDYMQSPLYPCPEQAFPSWPQPLAEWAEKYRLADSLLQKLEHYPAAYQEPGEAAGQSRLTYFLEEEHFHHYKVHISRPLESRLSCSRLSPHLAWGTLSLREVYQRALRSYKQTAARRPLQGFISRLHWHSHFIQKMEMEHRMEWANLNRGMDALDRGEDALLREAWEKGETGFPLVDACMRALHATGYINFRMRAMLVSFFTHHLWQTWESGVHHLARLFLDYHPGIHYPQFQMQSGTTGINSVRTYNPVKQSQDHDESGTFIRKWLPELEQVPSPIIHSPWKLSSWEQQWYNVRLGESYPLPIIDHQKQAAKARDHLHNAKKWPQSKMESQRILQRHTTANRNIDQRSRDVLQSS